MKSLRDIYLTPDADLASGKSAAGAACPRRRGQPTAAERSGPDGPDTIAASMPITAVVPWFGSNRTNAELPGKLLAGCTHITVAFAGSMCEVPHMPSAQLYVCDLHDDLINLAEIIAGRCDDLARRLETNYFHPKVLEDAQRRMREYRGRSGGGLFAPIQTTAYGELDRAADYFACCWMSRNGLAGTDGELSAGLALRGDGYGGDPVTRYRNAVASLQAWSRALQRCQFARESCWDTVARATERGRDLVDQGKEPRLGIYCDPPWPDDGDGYRHGFTDADQRRLARDLLGASRVCRVVIRYGDHPLIRELYPEGPDWTWHAVEGRTQARKGKAEVLIVGGGR